MIQGNLGQWRFHNPVDFPIRLTTWAVYTSGRMGNRNNPANTDMTEKWSDCSGGCRGRGMSAGRHGGYRWVVQSASESPQSPSGRLHRARALYRNVSKRRTAWLLLKDTVNSCMEYRILGLAAEAAFFTLLSVPPLLLCLIGLLAYVDTWTGAHTISSLETNILDA